MLKILSSIKSEVQALKTLVNSPNMANAVNSIESLVEKALSMAPTVEAMATATGHPEVAAGVARVEEMANAFDSLCKSHSDLVSRVASVENVLQTVKAVQDSLANTPKVG